MSLEKKCLIIFDCDGVIVDSAPHYIEIYNKICIKYNKSFPIKTLEEFRSWYDSKWENNFYRLGFSEKDIPEILDYESKIVNYDDITLFDNMKEILLELNKNYYMAIASTTPEEKIRKKLEKENLGNIFSIISGGDDGLSEKEMKIKKVIDYFNVSPDKCVMIGDTVMDIVSSEKLGIKCIALSCGWNSIVRLTEASPYIIIDSHKELLPAVRSIFALN
jgi:phosphoglycolate phosphatase